jgi:hypothetical protein
MFFGKDQIGEYQYKYFTNGERRIQTCKQAEAANMEIKINLVDKFCAY